jgi:ureidoglycolate lyase
MRELVAVALEASAYEPYGSVLSAHRTDVSSKAANQGTAVRRDFLADLVNQRPNARANLASFCCAPVEGWPRSLALLEKHPRSTQMFVPMNAKRYLIVVALGDEAPDLSTARAFIASGTQGITYRPGVWHHPMIALDSSIDFVCLVWEENTAEDCVIATHHDGIGLSVSLE